MKDPKLFSFEMKAIEYHFLVVLFVLQFSTSGDFRKFATFFQFGSFIG